MQCENTEKHGSTVPLLETGRKPPRAGSGESSDRHAELENSHPRFFVAFLRSLLGTPAEIARTSFGAASTPPGVSSGASRLSSRRARRGRRDGSRARRERG
jgi:hypothetical protein